MDSLNMTFWLRETFTSQWVGLGIRFFSRFTFTVKKIKTVTDGDICPAGIVNAIKDHTSENEEHFNAHHGGGLTMINYCVEVEDFDYVGDGFLGRIIRTKFS